MHTLIHYSRDTYALSLMSFVDRGVSDLFLFLSSTLITFDLIYPQGTSTLGQKISFLRYIYYGVLKSPPKKLRPRTFS